MLDLIRDSESPFTEKGGSNYPAASANCSTLLVRRFPQRALIAPLQLFGVRGLSPRAVATASHRRLSRRRSPTTPFAPLSLSLSLSFSS